METGGVWASTNSTIVQMALAAHLSRVAGRTFMWTSSLITRVRNMMPDGKFNP